MMEAVLAPFPEPSESLDDAVEIAARGKPHDGVHALLCPIHDADDGRRATIEGIAAKVSVPASRAEPVALHVTAGTGGIDVEASVSESGSAKVRSSGCAASARSQSVNGRWSRSASMSGPCRCARRPTTHQASFGRAFSCASR